jgi:hypothetical protein
VTALLWALLVFSLGVILLGSFTYAQGAPDPSTLWLLWFPGLLLLMIYARNSQDALDRRFGSGSREFIVANSRGLEGDVFPISRYRKSGGLNVVRTALFRRLVAVTRQEPNHGP